MCTMGRMDTTPKFKKTANYQHSGLDRTLHAETSGSVPNGLFLRVEAPLAFKDTGQAINLNRDEVTEFRDFLTQWLDATEVRIPTAVGSTIVDHSPYGDRLYVLLPESASKFGPGSLLIVWALVDGPRSPGWETAENLAVHVRNGRAEVKHDAGA